MNPIPLLKAIFDLLPTLINAFVVLVVGWILAHAFMYLGSQVRQGLEYRADQEVEIAKYSEMSARHEALESLYGSVKWEAVVANKNDKIEELGRKLQIACKKSKLKVCL